MTVYVVLKVAKSIGNEQVWATPEKAFSDLERANIYIKTMPEVWEEEPQPGQHIYCERKGYALELE